MLVKIKDAASFAGLTVVATIAILLAFTPFLVEKGALTLVQSVWISFALTVVSLIFFGIEKYQNSKDEEERRQQDAARDTLLKDISDRLKAVQQAQRTLTPQKAVALEQAHTLYSMLEKTANKPPAEVASLIRDGVKAAASRATDLKPDQIYFWTDITAMLNRKFTGSEKDRVDIRRVADSLVGSALDEPKRGNEK
jgi:ABC-type hemin transport system ATPase subunit